MRVWAAWLAAAACCWSQGFSHRGLLDTRLVAYPQTAPGDSGRAVAESLLRYEAFYRISPRWQVAGAFDARADTHHYTQRSWGLAWQDRTRRRPAFAARRMSAIYQRGRLTAEVGKQFIRWGKADVLNPTDRFAPRDFLAVVDNEFLAVNAARLTYGSAADTLDLVWSPRFTPSRIPLLNQRWLVLPEGLPEGLRLRDAGSRFPGGSQFGVRWNHVGSGFDSSVCYYEGFNHLPQIDARLLGLFPLRVELESYYPRLRMYGGDAALPLPWFTVKAEAGYFTSRTRRSQQYLLYVVQLERQAGEWFLVGGYAGEAVTAGPSSPGFDVERGLTRAFLARAGYTIDANRSLALEAAVRQNGKGAWTRLEYSQAWGQHWRSTAALTWIRGQPDDFLGQYHRNSHVSVVVRYSF